MAREFERLFAIDVVTLAFQQLSEDVADFVRLRLEARNRLVSLCRRLNVVLREKPVTPGAFVLTSPCASRPDSPVVSATKRSGGGYFERTKQQQQQLLLHDDYVLDLIRILYGYWELDLQALQLQYQSLYKAPLKAHIRQHVPDEILQLLFCAVLDVRTMCTTFEPVLHCTVCLDDCPVSVLRCPAGKQEGTPHEFEDAGAVSESSAAASLAAAAQSNNLFDGDGLFFHMLQILTREQLKEAFDALHMVRVL